MNVTVRVRLFGAFRDYGEGELAIDAPSKSRASYVREKIREEFLASGQERFARLAEISALGTEREILSEEDLVPDGVALALLPPVCGGSGETRVSVGVTNEPIDPLAGLSFLEDPAHGARSVFQGVIRDHNFGRKVLGVSYDVFEPLAVTTFERLAEEAREKWGEGLRIFIRHRRGRCAVGDIAVVVAVSSPHRDEAYQASRHLIEGIKHRSPIWKQEHFEDGDSEWVEGHALCRHGK